MRSAVIVAVATCLSTAIAACGASSGATGATPLRVLAASSLTEVLTELEDDVEAAEGNIDVELSFGASSTLAQQVVEGVGADVLVTADERTMAMAADAGAVAGDATVIARNRLTILVEPGNPQGVRELADLARRDLVVVLCAPEVPCGALARSVLGAAKVTVTPASLEENVKGVVSKVTLGEADAGIVYETDARASDADADTVAIDGADDERFEAVYPAAVVKTSEARDAAARFIRYLRSADAVEALEAAGFRSP